jgi:hypothetical protein
MYKEVDGCSKLDGGSKFDGSSNLDGLARQMPIATMDHNKNGRLRFLSKKIDYLTKTPL